MSLVSAEYDSETDSGEEEAKAPVTKKPKVDEKKAEKPMSQSAPAKVRTLMTPPQIWKRRPNIPNSDA